MMTLGRKLIPDRFRPEEIAGNAQDMRAYLTEVLVQPNSPLAGKTIVGRLSCLRECVLATDWRKASFGGE